VRLPVETWLSKGSTIWNVERGKPIASFVIDPDHVLPDDDRTNNEKKVDQSNSIESAAAIRGWTTSRQYLGPGYQDRISDPDVSINGSALKPALLTELSDVDPACVLKRWLKPELHAKLDGSRAA
jgi:hypothetical protein